MKQQEKLFLAYLGKIIVLYILIFISLNSNKEGKIPDHIVASIPSI
jgi:hypothetical protein